MKYFPKLNWCKSQPEEHAYAYEIIFQRVINDSLSDSIWNEMSVELRNRNWLLANDLAREVSDLMVMCKESDFTVDIPIEKKVRLDWKEWREDTLLLLRWLRKIPRGYTMEAVDLLINADCTVVVGDDTLSGVARSIEVLTTLLPSKYRVTGQWQGATVQRYGNVVVAVLTSQPFTPTRWELVSDAVEGRLQKALDNQYYQYLDKKSGITYISTKR